MANDFFTASGNPATGSQGSSATMRAEFESIEDAFDKLPALTGNGGKIVAVNSGGTALETLGTTTGTGNVVLATSPTINSPTLVTPVLGTPSSGTLTSCTGLPISTGVAGLGSNVATALAVNVGSSGAFVTNGGALGTPSSGTVTNLTGTASININGTVGATTPTTGAFTTVSASGVFTGPDGTAGAPTYSFSSSGNSDNGMYLSAANEVSWATSGTKRLTLTSDGRLYGTALHNNAGSVTGTTNQYIASGTYTPTATNLVNISSTTTYACQWLRVGNVVTVSGRIDIYTAATGTAAIRISLPIASTLGTDLNQCTGVGSRGTGGNVIVSIYSSSDNALFAFTDTDGNPYTFFTFTYVIN